MLSWHPAINLYEPLKICIGPFDELEKRATGVEKTLRKIHKLLAIKNFLTQ